MNDITIAGKLLSLKLMEHTELKGVFTDALLRYSFYKTGGQGNTFVLLQPKKTENCPHYHTRIWQTELVLFWIGLAYLHLPNWLHTRPAKFPDKFCQQTAVFYR